MSSVLAQTDDKLDAAFRALADARRRKILDLLRLRPRSTSELCAEFPELDRCTVMQHLGVLERADLIVVHRQGRSRLNALNIGPLLEIQARWLGPITGSAMHGLARLHSFTES